MHQDNQPMKNNKPLKIHSIDDFNLHPYDCFVVSAVSALLLGVFLFCLFFRRRHFFVKDTHLHAYIAAIRQIYAQKDPHRQQAEHHGQQNVFVWLFIAKVACLLPIEITTMQALNTNIVRTTLNFTIVFKLTFPVSMSQIRGNSTSATVLEQFFGHSKQWWMKCSGLELNYKFNIRK